MWQGKGKPQKVKMQVEPNFWVEQVEGTKENRCQSCMLVCSQQDSFLFAGSPKEQRAHPHPTAGWGTWQLLGGQSSAVAHTHEAEVIFK